MFVKTIYATRAASLLTTSRNGISAKIARRSLTVQSPKASETQNGAWGPKPKSEVGAVAQETSFPGSRKVSAAEKATVKKTI